MAEFQDVVRNMARMCAQQKNNCEGCTLYDDGIECPVEGPPEGWKLSKFTEIERIVSKWAAEHPEPVYPSWWDAWRQAFPEGIGSPCIRIFGERYKLKDCDEISCEECASRPIPADIAKKLGIKPVEGNNEQDRNGD